MKNSISVIKRDQTVEPLQSDKFSKIALATGLTEDESTTVAQLVENKITEIASKNNNSINSQDIRNILVGELEKISPRAADLYKWYEKTKYQGAPEK